MANKYKSEAKYRVNDQVVVANWSRRDQDFGDEAYFDFIKNSTLRNYKDKIGTVIKIIEMGDGLHGNKWFYKIKFVVDKNTRVKGTNAKMSNISYLVLKEEEIIYNDDAMRILYND